MFLSFIIYSGLTAAEATSDIINKQLPSLKSLMSSGELHVDNIDVFCEKGVFELADTEKILKAGKEIGLEINFHAEELNQLNSVEVQDVKVLITIDMSDGYQCEIVAITDMKWIYLVFLSCM
jgi:imidazolonepropionase-like amidohydrolase